MNIQHVKMQTATDSSSSFDLLISVSLHFCQTFYLYLMNMSLLGYTYKICNSSYNTDMVNKQCNAGDPLETYVNTIKRCACETLNQVQCSITLNVKLSVQSFQLASAGKSFEAGFDGWLSEISSVRLGTVF